MHDKELYRQILGIRSLWKVADVEQALAAALNRQENCGGLVGIAAGILE